MDLEAADRLDQVARYLNRGPSVAPRGPRSDPPCCRVFRVHIEVLRGPALNTGNARSQMRVHSANGELCYSVTLFSETLITIK
jgi:hypothetical protein